MNKAFFQAAAICACLLCSRAALAGCIEGDCKNGIGTWVWDNGNKYDGEFTGGKRTGHGTYVFSNGDKYVGEFRDGKFQGHGVYTYADGDVYDGRWESGKMAGKGVLKRADGMKQEGVYRDGAIVNSFNTDTEELREPDANKYPKGHLEKLMADPPETKNQKKPAKK